jgi:hypothetical protein
VNNLANLADRSDSLLALQDRNGSEDFRLSETPLASGPQASQIFITGDYLYSVTGSYERLFRHFEEVQLYRRTIIGAQL